MRAARLTIPEARRIDVRYDDVEADWAWVMRGIYAFLDLDIEPALSAMMRYARESEKKRHRFPHRYGLSDFGLEAEAVNARFRSYTEAFGLAGAAPAPRGSGEPILFPAVSARRVVSISGWKAAKAEAAARRAAGG